MHAIGLDRLFSTARELNQGYDGNFFQSCIHTVGLSYVNSAFTRCGMVKRRPAFGPSTVNTKWRWWIETMSGKPTDQVCVTVFCIHQMNQMCAKQLAEYLSLIHI